MTSSFVCPCDIDRYGRTVAEVWLDDGRCSTANSFAGFAWWYGHFAPHDTTLEQLEREAREAKRGLWADPDPNRTVGVAAPGSVAAGGEPQPTQYLLGHSIQSTEPGRGCTQRISSLANDKSGSSQPDKGHLWELPQPLSVSAHTDRLTFPPSDPPEHRE